jgi:hypothetical protein
MVKANNGTDWSSAYCLLPQANILSHWGLGSVELFKNLELFPRRTHKRTTFFRPSSTCPPYPSYRNHE